MIAAGIGNNHDLHILAFFTLIKLYKSESSKLLINAYQFDQYSYQAMLILSVEEEFQIPIFNLRLCYI